MMSEKKPHFEKPPANADALAGRTAQEEARLHQSLEDNKKFLQDLIDTVGSSVFVKDSQGRYVLSNKAHAEALGIPPGYALGKTDHDVHLREVAEKVRADDRKVLEAGKPIKIEETLRIRGSDHAMITVKTPLLDENGRPYAVCGIVTDITELRNLQAQLAQARKAEAVGILAGGIAHEFNNLLTVILMNVSLILLNFGPTHPHYDKLKSIEGMVENGARLTRKLLQYAREGIFRLKPVNLNHLVEETAEMFAKTRKDVTVYRELTQNLFSIEADPGQIAEVLSELFLNAADAMPGGGDLVLRTVNCTHEQIKGKLYDLMPGNYVLLTVSDTGSGMANETVQQIFEPFFTTKEVGKGTGLGLASVYGIIKSHGGYIDVHSEEGKGSTFSIYLPAIEGQDHEREKT